jgi:hypothetical protein
MGTLCPLLPLVRTQENDVIPSEVEGPCVCLWTAQLWGAPLWGGASRRRCEKWEKSERPRLPRMHHQKSGCPSVACPERSRRGGELPTACAVPLRVPGVVFARKIPRQDHATHVSDTQPLKTAKPGGTLRQAIQSAKNASLG